MFFGINTFLFSSPFTTHDLGLFPQFKAWGFDSVEMAIEDPSHIDTERAKAAFHEQDLLCASISGAWGPGRDLTRISGRTKGFKNLYTQHVRTLC